MKTKSILFIAIAAMSFCSLAVSAQSRTSGKGGDSSGIFSEAGKGGISAAMMSEIEKGYVGTAGDKAIRNALANNSINSLAVNADNAAMIDTHFSNRVKTKGITDQKSSGRCWLFTGLNVLRSRMIDKYDLGDFEFSQRDRKSVV